MSLSCLPMGFAFSPLFPKSVMELLSFIFSSESLSHFLAQDEGNGLVWVHNNKQGFLDCEPYARLEEWLGKVADEYWDNKFDSLNVVSTSLTNY